MKTRDISNNGPEGARGEPMELARALEVLRDLGPVSTPDGLEERAFLVAMEQPESTDWSFDSLFVAAWQMATVSVAVAVIMVAVASLRSEPRIPASSDHLFALASMPELDADAFLTTVLDGSTGGVR